MKLNMKILSPRIMLKGAVIILLACSPYLSQAQGPEDPGGDPDAVPIDGGISLLIAAGVGYGAKKLHEAKKKKKEADDNQDL